MQNIGVINNSQEPETNLINTAPQFSTKFNLGEQFPLSYSQINNFQQQIKQIEQELAIEERKQQLKNIELYQSHFYFKKDQGKGNGGQININMEFIDDKVFKNIEDKHIEQIEKIFNQAKTQISRLENILVLRDNEIANLNQKINQLKQIDSNVVNQSSQSILSNSNPSIINKYQSTNNTENNAFQSLKQEFNALKTDNLLLYQDIQVLKQQLDNVTQISQSKENTIQKLNQQINKLVFDKNNYLFSLQELKNSLSKQKQTNLLANKQIFNLNQYIKGLQFDKNQLHYQLTQTNQSNLQIIRSNSHQQLIKEIDRLKNQKLLSQNSEQQLKKQFNFLRFHKETTDNKINQLQDKLLILQQNSKKYQEIISKSQIENEHIKNINNSLTIDYQSIKHKLQNINTQLTNKNILILELQNKLEYTQKKQPIRNKQYESVKHNDSGIITNRKLNFESPSKMLTIQTPQQLIQYSRELLKQGLVVNNLSKLHSVLDLTTNQLQIARRQNQKLKMLRQQSNPNSNFITYKNQTEAYIQNLLKTIQKHQLQNQKSNHQNKKLNLQMQQIKSRNMNNQQLINDLNQEKKLTQLLSDRIKTIESELFELTRQLNAKNQQIYDLQTKLNRNRRQSVDLEDKSGKINYQYSQVNQNQYQMRAMAQQINVYKLELEKALHLNQKLREYISKPSKFSCNECQQYQLANQDLKKRLQQYEGVVVEYQKIFKSQEKPVVNRGRILLKTRVNNLKDKTNDNTKRHGIDISLYNQLYESKKARSSEKIKLSTRTIHKKHTVLDHLVESQKLSFETLLILMLKIVIEADNQKLFHSQYPILPEHIEILDYDRFHPDNMKVQLAESRQFSSASKLSLYLAPQRLRSCQPTRKSLVWNIGLIFDFMIHKQPYFQSQSEIVNNNISYKFKSDQYPKLKHIVCSMLQKEISKRKMFADIKTMISAELVGLQKLRLREDK